MLCWDSVGTLPGDMGDLEASLERGNNFSQGHVEEGAKKILMQPPPPNL